GLRQLDIAREILFLSGRYQYILQRLVYVAAEPVTVLEDLPVLPPEDEYAELGVIWVPSDAVDEAAQELGLELPEDWLTPESREGFMEDPERDEWKQFADTSARESQETDVSADNPLAEALRRAMENR